MVDKRTIFKMTPHRADVLAAFEHVECEGYANFAPHAIANRCYQRPPAAQYSQIRRTVRDLHKAGLLEFAGNTYAYSPSGNGKDQGRLNVPTYCLIGIAAVSVQLEALTRLDKALRRKIEGVLFFGKPLTEGSTHATQSELSDYRAAFDTVLTALKAFDAETVQRVDKLWGAEHVQMQIDAVQLSLSKLSLFKLVVSDGCDTTMQDEAVYSISKKNEHFRTISNSSDALAKRK